MDSGRPTLAVVLGSWTFAPVTDLLVLFAVAGYVALVLARRRAGAHWPVPRAVCALAAAVVMVLTVDSGLAVYEHRLFSVHMVTHLLLIMVVPALVVAAQPIRLLHDAAGLRVRSAVDRPPVRRVFRLLISPWFTVPVYATVLVLTHLTGFQQAMAGHMWIHSAEQWLYLASGYLLLLPLLGAEFTAGLVIPSFLRFVVLAVCMGPDTLVGVVLMMTGTPIAPAYAASRDWGPTALADQRLAGAIMWFGGDGLMMIVMLVVAAMWVSAGDRAGGLGPWLDRIRIQATLGTDGGTGDNIDDDEAALAAYNQRLKALHHNTIQSTSRRSQR
jgi:putative membrane protein